MAKKKKSLVEQIAELSSSKPQVEDDFGDYTTAKAGETYDEEENDDYDDNLYSSGHLRMRPAIDMDDEEDETYKGKKINRKQLYDEEEGEEVVEEEEDEDEDEGEQEDEDGEGEGGEFEDNEDDGEGEENDEDDKEEEDGNEVSEEDSDSEEGNGLSSTLKLLDREDALFSSSVGNNKGDMERGNHTRRQKEVWDDLMETRIASQKILSLSNSLPQQHSFSLFNKETKISKTINETSNSLKSVLDGLFDFRDYLVTSNPSLSTALQAAVEEGAAAPNVSRKRKRGEISVISVEEYMNEIEGGEERMKPFIEAVLQRWNDRVTLSSGKTNVKKFKALNNSITSQVDLTMSDMKRLERKAHTVRSTYTVIGGRKEVEEKESSEERDKKGRSQEKDLEIYDDADFYHQLLKEFVQSSGEEANDANNALKFKYPKSKKNVDTKASKGRKIRYQVHPKILNFIAPEEQTSTTMDVDELFSSLFGQRKGLPISNL